MPSLSVRRLDQESYDRLSQQAKSHGRSMEEEARQILIRAVSAPAYLGDYIVSAFSQIEDGELEIAPRVIHQAIDLDS